MIRTTELKERIYNYMELADDKVLEAINTLLETSVGQTYTLTDEQLSEVEKRRTKYLSGEAKMYDWKEAKNRIGKRI
jgi:hypothetical protein